MIFEIFDYNSIKDKRNSKSVYKNNSRIRTQNKNKNVIDTISSNLWKLILTIKKEFLDRV